MAIDRRTALGHMAAAGAAVLGAAAPVGAREPRPVPADAVGLLYDPTRCVGCKTCMVACREANGLDAANDGDLWYEPDDLSADAKTVVKLFRGDHGTSYMKMQCMHCVDPACVSGCMLGALQKREHGIVTWDPDRCVGCRYCQIACPFGVPRFQWESATPKIVKCEMCSDRIAQGGIPACAEVCPGGAIEYGPRQELLEKARSRIAAAPDRYEPRIYGEHDGGGTQVLYLSAAGIPFTDLGLPDLGERAVPATAETVQHTVYRGFIAPVVLYGLLAGVVIRNRRLSTASPEDEEKKEVEP